MPNHQMDIPSPATLQDWPSVWEHCCHRLQEELPAQQFNTWVRPLKPGFGNLQGDMTAQGEAVAQRSAAITLLAPNRFIRDWVADKFLPRISELVAQAMPGCTLSLETQSAEPGNNRTFARYSSAAEVGSSLLARGHPDGAPTNTTNDWFERRRGIFEPPAIPANAPRSPIGATGQEVFSELYSAAEDAGPKLNAEEQGVDNSSNTTHSSSAVSGAGPGIAPALLSPQNRRIQNREIAESDTAGHQHNLIDAYRFENFVEGKSNQLARAAASQVVENPGGSYNPLFLYGGVGLGKTHLMHAVGNELKRRKPGAKVVYLHSERFVADMVKALQLNAINDFKRFYRSVDALLIDDIQFFANKERSQEEFFHTFNALLEGGQQMILTCDRYPKEISGVEERLKSRFGWGLTVAVEPPELETRVAILMKKADQAQMPMSHDSAFFLAQRVRSNVRELEGALKRVIASAHFTKSPITVDLIKESLKDLLALQDKQVSIDNIQRTTAEYYKIKVADLMSKRRNRSVARPRQVAMALAKELTNHSLPEIGDAFGGRDHTTVLHACRKIKELRDTSSDIQEDYQNLLRTLAT